LPVKGRAKPIGARAGVNIHGEEGVCDFRDGERLGQGVGGDGHGRIEISHVEIPTGFTCPSKKIQVEVVENGAFGSMSTVVVTPL